MDFPVTAPDESQFFAAMSKKRRSFNTVAFPLKNYPKEEIAKYAAANVGLFTVVHVSQITMPDEKELAAVLAKIKDKTPSFADAAKNNSKDSYAEKGGDRGNLMVNELSSVVTDKAERAKIGDLKKGQYSKVMKAPGGFVVLMAQEDPRPANVNEDADLTKIKNYMLTNEKGKIEDYFIAQAKTLAEKIKASDFATACSAAGLSTATVGPLALNYGDSNLLGTTLGGSKDASYFSNAAYNEDFWRTAWKTPLNTPSSPVVAGDNVVVLYPTAETTADQTTLNNVDKYYTGTFLKNYENRAAMESVFSSSKFVNNFFQEYLKLYSKTHR
jgi:hypothetical protein